MSLTENLIARGECRITRQDDYLVETRIMARNIKEAPIPDIIVKVSPKKRNEIAIATIGSVNRMTVEVTGEMCLNPLSHK